MHRAAPAIPLLLVMCLSTGAQDRTPQEGAGQPPTPKEQYETLLKQFNTAAHGLWTAQTDEDRKKAVAAGEGFPQKLLELAEKHPGDPIALDALVQVVNQEIWLENNTQHPGFGNDSRERKALAILLRDHLRSERLGEATRRVMYGFREECESFLRAVLEASPHHDIRGLACLRLAQFLKGRSARLDLLQDQPDVVKRYEGFFGKDYLDKLRRQGRAAVTSQIEDLFEQAIAKYGDVKLPYGGTVGQQATSELFELRHLAVGKEALEIEGPDQDGRQFKLTDYRGKVVLLYFWSEF
jgi:hypothetical protein